MKYFSKKNILLEQIDIQKKIIEDLNKKIILLEEENATLKKNQKFVEICAKCGNLFFFTSAIGCCDF